jgi:hypothetical protein
MFNLFKFLTRSGYCSECETLKLEIQSLTADIARMSRTSENRADALKRNLLKTRGENKALKKQIHDALGKKKRASKRKPDWRE